MDVLAVLGAAGGAVCARVRVRGGARIRVTAPRRNAACTL